MNDPRLALLTLALVLVLAPRVSAQSIRPGAAPLWGSTTIDTTLSRDPLALDGLARGAVSLASAGAGCRGFAEPAPSFVVTARAAVRFLAIMVNADYDTTLLVRTPDGHVLCNDDTDGQRPRLEISSTAGVIEIWVGAATPGDHGPFRMALSATDRVRSPELGLPLAPVTSGLASAPPAPRLIPLAPPVYGTVSLASGVRQATILLTGMSGGSVPPYPTVTDCAGSVTAEPSHVVMAQTPFQNLRLVVAGENNIALVVQYPDGHFVCTEHAGGSSGGDRHTVVEGPTGAGPVRIWVSVGHLGRPGGYWLGVTEDGAVVWSMLRGMGTATGSATTATTSRTSTTSVRLAALTPTTIFGGGSGPPATALWTPRRGTDVEIGAVAEGTSLRVFARIDGQEVAVGTVALPRASEAVITVTLRRDGKLLVRAAHADGSVTLMLVRWDARGRTPALVHEWTGSGADPTPRWSR